MSGSSKKKYRHEYKYVCDALQNSVLKVRVQGLMSKDSHAENDGAYRIRSLYFDDLEDRCYYENESGIGERDKYRIRIYNGDSSRIMLEKKSKLQGMTLKAACRITEEQCHTFMHGRIPAVSEEMPQIQQQLFEEMQLKCMRPVVIVEYVRYPFVEKNGNVRVTFDENICSSNEIAGFLKKDLVFRPIMAKGQSVLEIKWDEFLPDYLKKQLQLDSLARSSFSKYYLCRKYNIYGGVII